MSYNNEPEEDLFEARKAFIREGIERDDARKRIAELEGKP